MSNKKEVVFSVNGKKYQCVKDYDTGVVLIDGMTIDEFMKSLTREELIQFVIEDEGKEKKRSPQTMLNELHQAKNN